VEDSPLRHDLAKERLQAESDGSIIVPDRPGLGVTLNEDCVREFLVSESGV
jgi:L-alanine-DL-glutamate epimerase-like enolase superfamily enzyme